MATFEETPVQKGKVWVKAGTFDAGSRSKYSIFFWVGGALLGVRGVKFCEVVVVHLLCGMAS